MARQPPFCDSLALSGVASQNYLRLTKPQSGRFAAPSTARAPRIRRYLCVVRPANRSLSGRFHPQQCLGPSTCPRLRGLVISSRSSSCCTPVCAWPADQLSQASHHVLTPPLNTHLNTRHKTHSLLYSARISSIKGMRIIQLAAFSLSNTLYRIFAQTSTARPGAATDEWADVTIPETLPPLRASRGVITYHPWYQDFHAKQVAECLAAAAALSCGYVRSDVRWSDVLSDGVHPDERAISWYRSYLRAHQWYGMRPMIVLSDPPAAVLRLSRQVDVLMERWFSYVDLVAERFGDLCDTYQVMNEPNNPIYRFFPSNRQGAAITAAADAIHAHTPGAQILVNILMDLGNWRESMSHLLDVVGGAVDVIGIDHYPGTWTLSDKADWGGFITLAHEVANATPDSHWRHVRLALIETGFATNAPWFRTAISQARYLDEVRRIVSQVDTLQPGGLLSHIGIYELVDLNSNAILDPEAHFGLITSHLTRKAGFSSVASFFASAAVSRR